MIDRFSQIELNISNSLSSIDGTIQPTGYQYYSKTGQIQVYDEVLSLGRNITTSGSDYKSVNYVVEQDEGTGVENQDWSTGQYAYTQRTIYNIDARVHNIGNEGNARNAIRQRMNEVLCDLLYKFGKDYTLGGQVAYIRFYNSARVYDDVTNNRIMSGILKTKWEIIFTQSFNDPNIPACM